MFYVAPSNFTSVGSDCGSNCRSLEVTQDHIGGAEWCGKYDDQFINSSKPTGVGIGTGFSNTAKAAEVCTSGAIQRASVFTSKGKSDWYVPSKDELNLLYMYLYNFKREYLSESDDALQKWGSGQSYWSSSSEYQGQDIVWVQNEYGQQELKWIRYTANVRPIRAF